MLDIVAYLLQANGARCRIAGARARAASTVRACDRAPTAGRRAAGAGRGAASRRRRRRCGAAPRLRGRGLTVTGEVKNFVPVTDEMLRKPDPGDWLMFRGNYHGWSYSPLKEITSAERRRSRAGLGVGDVGRRREPVASARAQRHPLPAQPEQHRAGARRADRQPDLGAARRPRTARRLRRTAQLLDLAGQDSLRGQRRAHGRARRAHRQAAVGDAGRRHRAGPFRDQRIDCDQRQGAAGPQRLRALQRRRAAGSARSTSRPARSRGSSTPSRRKGRLAAIRGERCRTCSAPAAKPGSPAATIRI